MNGKDREPVREQQEWSSEETRGKSLLIELDGDGIKITGMTDNQEVIAQYVAAGAFPIPIRASDPYPIINQGDPYFPDEKIVYDEKILQRIKSYEPVLSLVVNLKKSINSLNNSGGQPGIRPAS